MLIAELMVLQAKLEVTYGTDPTPDATNALLAKNIDITPVSAQIADRQKAHASYGLDPDVHVNNFQQLTFDVGLAGSGAAGTAPLYGPLLRACNLAEVLSAGVKVDYTLAVYAPATAKSVTIYFNVGGKQYKMTGARGTASFVLGPNGLPYIRFTFTGLVVAATDTALPSVETTLASWIAEVEVNKANTTPFTIGGYAATLQNFQLDLNNTVTARDRPNSSVVSITNAGPKGQISFEMPAVGTLDVETVARAGTLSALVLQHGQTAGNIVKITATNLQLLQPKPQVVDGILHVQANFALTRNAGIDDTTISVK